MQRRKARRAVAGLGGGRLLDPDAQVVPGGLPGDRVGVGETVGGAVLRGGSRSEIRWLSRNPW